MPYRQNGLVIPISLACRAPESLSIGCEYSLLVCVAESAPVDLPVPPKDVPVASMNILGSSSTVLSVAPPVPPAEEKQLIAGNSPKQTRLFF